MISQFIISLDFELLWGLRDLENRESYGRNIMGGREAIPKMLELFENADVGATWATVGALFCRDRDELMDLAPQQTARPLYDNPKLSTYSYLSELGRNEIEDPYYFAGSLIEAIGQTPRQEIATHTFSHFYALEAGSTIAAFEADLQAACTIASLRGVTLRSIVFPRNQYSATHIAACLRAGITNWRGNPEPWAYASSPWASQTWPRRALRLLDAHTGVLGAMAYAPPDGDAPLRNIPASRLLRPVARRPLAWTHGTHIAVIKRGMTQAAKTGQCFHLWWHPHNFGADVEANMAGLRAIVAHFQTLKDRYGMQSMTMAEASA